jgi:hypothetical protein
MPPLEKVPNAFKNFKLEYPAIVRELPSNQHTRERLEHYGPRRFRRQSSW